MNQQALDLPEPKRYEYPDWWPQWLKHNQAIYRKFVEVSLKAKRVKRFKKWSGWAAVQIVRWETPLAEKDGQFKIRNEAIGYLSRQAMEDYPELEGFFRVRDGLGRDA